MKHSKIVLAAGAICLSLYMLTLFTPLALDQAAFANGGDLIRSGGKIYKDYYDQKPPVIYYAYSVFGWIAGNNDIGYHAIDAFWQMAVCLSLMYCLRKITGNIMMGAFVAIAYTMLYVSAGYLVNLQCEALVAPALVWLLFLSSSEAADKTTSPYLRGALAGLCFGVKYPMGILLLFLFLQSITSLPFVRALVRIIKEALGFLVVATLLLLPFLDSEIRTGYFRILPYNLFYASLPPIDLNFVKLIVKGLGSYAGDSISILFIGCIALACFLPLIIDRSIEKIIDMPSKHAISRLIRSCMVMTVFLLISIIAERKLIPYHFVRIMPSVAVLIGIGAYFSYRLLRAALPGASLLSRCSLIIAGALLLALSPLARLAYTVRTAWIAIFSDKHTYYQAFRGSDMNGLPWNDISSICDRIGGDRYNSLFVMGHTASLFYRHLQTRPVPRFAFPPYYFAVITIPGMKEEVIEDLKKVEWLVVQTDDGYIGQLGHTKSSWESLNSDAVLSAFVFSRFVVVETRGVFKVLKNKEIMGEL